LRGDDYKERGTAAPLTMPGEVAVSMQITRYQVKDGCSSFKFDAAIAGINLSSHVSNGT
jgi:hypothetical protein